MQWLGLLFPIILAIIFKFKYKNEFTWLEYLGSITIAFITISICCGIYCTSNSMDTKLVSGYVCGKDFTPAHMETYTYSCGTPKSPRMCTGTRYVPDDFDIYIGRSYKPSEEDGSGMHGYSGVRSFDVDRNYYYSTHFGETAVWEESFENPLKRSKSSLYKKVTGDKYPNLDTPNIYNRFKINRITNISNVTLDKDYNELVSELNSQLNRYNINIGYIIHPYDINFVNYQEQYWTGGNPNDFVVFIAVDSNGNISNVKVLKWGNELLALELQDAIMKTTNIANFGEIISITENKVSTIGFLESDFSRFNYIKTVFPAGFLIFIYIFTFIVSLFSMIGFINNDIGY